MLFLDEFIQGRRRIELKRLKLQRNTLFLSVFLFLIMALAQFPIGFIKPAEISYYYCGWPFIFYSIEEVRDIKQFNFSGYEYVVLDFYISILLILTPVLFYENFLRKKKMKN